MYNCIRQQSKGLFDALNNELPQDDKKSAAETPIIEEQMRRMFGRCRMYWLKTEEDQLASRAEEKERTGEKARHKHMNEREPNSSYQSS
eukprot:10360861-Karenia_brevis.AAC.1